MVGPRSKKKHSNPLDKYSRSVIIKDWLNIKRGTPLNLNHFLIRFQDSGDWRANTVTENAIKDLLKTKIDTVNFAGIKDDISRFIADPKDLIVWSPKYFHDLIEYLKFNSLP